MKGMMGPGRFVGLGARMGLLFASLCLGACVLGGTGSDHENGVGLNAPNEIRIKGVTARVTDGDGSPIAGVSLFLYDPAYRPDLGLARPSQLTDTAPAPVTDSLGYARLDLSAPGKFVVEGVSAGKTLFFDTLAAPIPNQAAIFTFRARAAVAFRGRVSLVSGMRTDSGSVFIRGTSRTARLDAAGNYDLGNLPWDAGRMGLGIRYVSSPVAVQESRQISGSDSGKADPVTGLPPYVCKDVVAQESKAGILSQPPRAPGADTVILTKEMVDSAQLGRALDACDILSRGGVVNVVSRDVAIKTGGKGDSAVPMLVLEAEKVLVSFNGTKVVPATVIPYAGCVPAAGLETTNYAVKVQASDAKSDILIADVAPSCLEK